jgi:L-amino acid N-acyltransferase YncA
MGIRLATIDDLPRIVEIYNAAIPGRMATADTRPVTVASRERWFVDHDPATRPLLVLEEERAGGGAVVVAWASLQSFYGRPAYQGTAEVSVYVAPDQHRRGHGRRLLAEVIARAPSLAVTTLLGCIFAHNLPSIRLFEAHGFTRWGHLPRVAILDGVDRDLVILGRRLVP